jgi:hypothetical protein
MEIAQRSRFNLPPDDLYAIIINPLPIFYLVPFHLVLPKFAYIAKKIIKNNKLKKILRKK